jgi:hypothetical protein
MAHNQVMLQRNPQWKDQAEIVGLSIDDDREAVSAHVAAKGWTSVTHLWCGPHDMESRADSVYGVQGVPTCFLWDRSGTVRPASLFLAVASVC